MASIEFDITITNALIEPELDPVIETDTTQDVYFRDNFATTDPVSGQGMGQKVSYLGIYIDISQTSMTTIFENYLYLDPDTPISSYSEDVRNQIISGIVSQVKAESRLLDTPQTYIPAQEALGGEEKDNIDTSIPGQVYTITWNENGLIYPSTFLRSIRSTGFLRIPGNTQINSTLQFITGNNFFTLPISTPIAPETLFSEKLHLITKIVETYSLTEEDEPTTTDNIIYIPAQDYNTLTSDILRPGKVYVLLATSNFQVTI